MQYHGSRASMYADFRWRRAATPTHYLATRLQRTCSGRTHAGLERVADNPVDEPTEMGVLRLKKKRRSLSYATLTLQLPRMHLYIYFRQSIVTPQSNDQLRANGFRTSLKSVFKRVVRDFIMFLFLIFSPDTYGRFNTVGRTLCIRYYGSLVCSHVRPTCHRYDYNTFFIIHRIRVSVLDFIPVFVFRSSYFVRPTNGYSVYFYGN